MIPEVFGRSCCLGESAVPFAPPLFSSMTNRHLPSYPSSLDVPRGFFGGGPALVFSLPGATRPSRRLAEVPFEARFLLLSPSASQLSPAQAGPSVDSHFVSDTREFILSPAHAQPLSSSTTQRALRREGDGIMGLGCSPAAAQLLSSCLKSGVPIKTSFISLCENPATALPARPGPAFYLLPALALPTGKSMLLPTSQHHWSRIFLQFCAGQKLSSVAVSLHSHCNGS